MGTVDSRLAGAFGLDEDGWRRHANPWSVYTRIPIPALLAAAVWSRVWIGWWAWLPALAVCAWAVLNPRLFPPPRSHDNWASKAVLGEIRWAASDQVPVPARHRLAPVLLTVLNALGVPFVVWGLITLDGWMVLFGLAVHMAGKNWFMDRMALLHDDMATDRTEVGR